MSNLLTHVDIFENGTHDGYAKSSRYNPLIESIIGDARDLLLSLQGTRFDINVPHSVDFCEKDNSYLISDTV